MARALAACGIAVYEGPHSLRIEGGQLGGAEVDSRGDHRIAMAMAVAAQVATGDIRIADCANVDTSFPGFLELASGAGMRLALA
jgi:3-phosphoshikimate 1-carboxyvinyltransferase